MEPMKANSRLNIPTESDQGRKTKRTYSVWSSFMIVGKKAQGKEQYGLKEIDDFIHKVRESVKYVRASQTRKQKFIECIKRVHLDSRRGLRQNIHTIWNSTYLMLDSVIYYLLVLTALEFSDSNYKYCPSEKFVIFVYERLYSVKSKQLEEVKEKLFVLCNEYVTSAIGRSTIRSSPQSHPSTSSGQQRVNDLDLVLLDFDNNIDDDIVDIQTTQLDLYLEERRLKRSMDLNILDFWKGNEPRYPKLVAMAHDV
ncbi:hypothetical protein Ddye_009589 [Dipteronia dyeriana]|uniref:HAT C-terminal dimerisation domain-containing protein n=1 Tax=Dipteronia dyeriana TaxID=168575 RepID=A0AAD9XC23_9ROSI|nr:hypothetical protein Ddye_009589 [Dipteronia dyeriana]